MVVSKKNRTILIYVLLCFISQVIVFADSNYVVKKGDTLYSISRKFELTVAELRAANNLSENDVLKEGAKLVIPSADITNAAALSSSSKNQISAASSVSKVSTKNYEVQKGDTLYGIARKSGIKVPELLSLNNFDSNMTLKIGQKIKIPASEDSYVQAKPAVSKTDVKKTVEANIKTAQKNSVNTTVSISSGVQWPLSNPVVKNISGKISGVILTGKNNEAVKCVHEGTVMYNGVYRGFGEVVFIQSKTGLIYSYTGLGEVSAKKGDYVLSGTEIGKTGKEATIKFMVFQNGKPLDPAKAPRG